MRINRRQFLIFLGSLIGLSSGFYWQKKRASVDVHSSPSHLAPQPLTLPTEESITTSPAPEGLFAPVKGDIRLIVISDLNSQYGSIIYEPQVGNAITLIPQWQPDLILCAGDMVAGQKLSLSSPQIQAMWSGFERNIAQPLQQNHLPFALTIGNHDASGALNSAQEFIFEKERQIAQDYWQKNKQNLNLKLIDESNFPFQYSFQHHGIYYSIIDASTFQLSTQSLSWLKKSLVSPEAQAAQMRIVMGHLPLYAVAVGRNQAGEVLEKGDELRMLLEQYHVDLYISGHHHAYFPGQQGRLKLLHAGALGSGPRPLLNGNLPPQNTLTVVDINLKNPENKQKTIVYTTYEMKTLAVVDGQTLPEKIESYNHSWVLRDQNI
jgi:3',5'-cyclic AMP phosphodiesterase CpdA